MLISLDTTEILEATKAYLGGDYIVTSVKVIAGRANESRIELECSLNRAGNCKSAEPKPLSRGAEKQENVQETLDTKQEDETPTATKTVGSFFE